MSIRLFVTGGTFDKEYNELDGELFFKDTHVRAMLDRGRCKLPVQVLRKWCPVKWCMSPWASRGLRG